jgi:hypothetical protein
MQRMVKWKRNLNRSRGKQGACLREGEEFVKSGTLQMNEFPPNCLGS